VKRIVTLGLALVLFVTALGATSCRRENPLQRLYRETVEHLFNLNTVEAELALTLRYEGEGLTAEIPFEGLLAAEGLTKDGGENLRFSARGAVGQREMWLYGVADRCYYRYAKLCGSIPTDGISLTAWLSCLTPQHLLLDGVLKGLSVREGKEGRVLEAVLSGEAMKEIVLLSTEQPPAVPECLDDVTLGFLLSEKGLTSVMYLDLAFAMPSGSVTVSAVVTYRSLGGAASVEAPEGYETFEEKRPDELFG